MNLLTIMHYIIAFLESIILFRLFDNMLTPRLETRYRFVPFIVSLGILPLKQLLEALNSSPILDLFIKPIGVIYLVFIAFYFYKDSIKRKLLISFLFFAIIVVSELFVVIILMLTVPVPFSEIILKAPSFFIGMLFIKVVSIILTEQIIRRTKGSKQLSFSYTKELAVILSANLVLFVLALQVIVQPTLLLDKLHLYIYIMLGCLAFISLLSCYIIVKIAKKSKQELETQLKIQQMEMEMKLNDDMSIMIDKLRSLRHDMNNHIGVMLGLVKTAQYEELSSYLSGMYEDIEQSNDIVYHPNKALMVLLNNKLAISSSQDIEIDLAIQIKEVPIPDKDLCTLLGNILDNAIEASSKRTDNRNIRLVLKQKGSQFLISCENTFETTPTVKNGSFITSKRDSSIHGIGLKNIKSIVDSYHGILDISYDDVFQINIVLNV